MHLEFVECSTFHDKTKLFQNGLNDFQNMCLFIFLLEQPPLNRPKPYLTNSSKSLSKIVLQKMAAYIQ